jgi:Ran GTPase-activating protein (RanGAP) involved in mRNA processing and transport
MLKVQCLLKNICTEAEWPEIRESIAVDYIEDNFFSELKDFEILGERLNMLDQIQPHIGKYYSDKWVRSNILNMSEEDVERMEAEIADEPEPEEDDLGF